MKIQKFWRWANEFVGGPVCIALLLLVGITSVLIGVRAVLKHRHSQDQEAAELPDTSGRFVFIHQPTKGSFGIHDILVNPILGRPIAGEEALIGAIENGDIGSRFEFRQQGILLLVRKQANFSEVAHYPLSSLTSQRFATTR